MLFLTKIWQISAPSCGAFCKAFQTPPAVEICAPNFMEKTWARCRQRASVVAGKTKGRQLKKSPASKKPDNRLLVLDDRAGDLGLISVENPAPEPILLDLRIDQGVSILALHRR